MELVWRRPETGTLWKLAYLKAAADDAKFLSPVQYDHVVGQFEEIALYEDPIGCGISDIERIENYYELKEKGGVLGKLNVRAYFTLEKGYKAIVVLSVYKKEDEAKAPRWLKIRLKNRLSEVRKQLKMM